MTAARGGGVLTGALLDGRYRVREVIASGGTSTVYRGVDERLDRAVALKVMDARYAGDRQFLTRFQREARAVAKLHDPGVVAVYDQGADAGHPFLVMELVDGGTLRELLDERGPMPPHAVAAVLRPVLAGLAAAHRAGLVHRDIKPENILIGRDGAVKIVDFGLVRAIAEAGITSTSVIVGTAAYLSPEQVRGGEIGPPSDVYGAGILGYELLTGSAPFTGDSALTVAYRRLDHDVPPPSAAIDGVPAEFDALIGRATARDPRDRFPDAAAMGGQLELIAQRLALPAFRVPTPHRAAARPPAPPRPTLQLTREPEPWTGDDPDDDCPPEPEFVAEPLSGYLLARQHARRMMLIWLAALFALTGLVAAIAWTLGNDLGAAL